MRLTRTLVGLALLCFCTPALAQADDFTPVPADNPTPVAQPTSSPVVTQPSPTPPSVDTPPPVSTPVSNSSPVPVAREHNPTLSVTQSVTQPGTAEPVGQGDHPFTSPPTSTGRTHAATRGQSPGFSSNGSTGITNPPPVSDSGLSPLSSSLIDGSSGFVSAAAPSQLSCRGKKKDTAAPFLASPFAGWTDLNSFLDHDNPDYEHDGTIVIANGLTARASDGESSDFFPAYWSGALRQYVNYDGHNGYDYGVSYQSLFAAAAGTVRYAGWNGGSEYEGYGLMVLIDHHNGYVTLYGHLSKLEVRQGDKVTLGQEIGISGSTGNSSGPHLHFSVFHNCQVTDPYGWTGNGPDPLEQFDGETASYLWLPGADPLVLNPPPNWPSFPLGSRLSIVHLSGFKGQTVRVIPPADRLLLLHLPSARGGTRDTAAVAVARTQALVTQEAESLTLFLEDLKAQGYLEAYQVMPPAAAVWVRGTASADQLEALPGVASLAGTRPNDVRAAQIGLAHSILTQMGPQRAPSLWPVGFRSGLDSWRPIATVSAGQATIGGFALPGQQILISLRRRGSLAGATRTAADPESGGFAAMIHDRFGIPVEARQGDTVELQIGGRTAQVRVRGLSIKARARGIIGKTEPGSTVAVTITTPSGQVGWKSLTVSGPTGLFSVRILRALPAGSLTVAALVDSAGNQESTSAFVPGVIVAEGSATVHGWAVGRSPVFHIDRKGQTILEMPLQRAADGAFQIDLRRRGRAVVLRPGDIVRIGSPGHQRNFRLPELSVELLAGRKQIGVVGPPHALIRLTCRRADGRRWTFSLRLDKPGHARWPWPLGGPSIGDSASIELPTRTGDTVQLTRALSSIGLHEGDSLVTGRVNPRASLRIHLRSRTGAMLASAVTTADRSTGRFRTRLLSTFGAPVQIAAGSRVEVQTNTGIITIAVSPLSLSVDRQSAAIVVGAPPGTHPLLTLLDARGRKHLLPFTPGSNGRAFLHPTGISLLTRTQQLTLAVAVGTSFTIERDVVVTRDRPARGEPAATRTKPRTRGH